MATAIADQLTPMLMWDGIWLPEITHRPVTFSAMELGSPDK